MRYISFWKKGHTIFFKNEFFRFCFVVTAPMQNAILKVALTRLLRTIFLDHKRQNIDTKS